MEESFAIFVAAYHITDICKVLWFSLSWQHRTMQLLSHFSSLPSGMGRRIRRKRQNSWVV